MKSRLIFAIIFIIFFYSIAGVCAQNDTVINEEAIPANNESYSISEDENDFILKENEDTVLDDDHFGYWLWSTDVKGFNLSDASNHGVTDIFLNYYAFTRYNESVVETFALNAKDKGINVHIWTQIFFDGHWTRPIDRNGNVNYEFFDNKTAEMEYYAGVKGIAGIHYDYLRFSGSEYYNNTAWQNPGGKEAITYFVKKSTDAIRKVNPDLIISAALMPEPDWLEPVYGVEYSKISGYFDVVIPMTYRGNFKQDTAWIANMTRFFIDNSTGARVWAGLQGYVDDERDDIFVPEVQMAIDSNAALDAGANGVLVFRYNCCENIDFNNLSVDENQLHSFNYLNYKVASTFDVLNLENDFAFNESSDGDYVNGIANFRPNITINGNNHIIDAKNLSKIFNISVNNVTLKNIQFKNAFTSDEGAALYITGGHVKIINCSFIDNNAATEAAAIYLIGNQALIDNCTFINNSAKYTGAILIRSHDGCINNSYFENNNANISAGAVGLAFRNNTSIQNSVFINNGAYNEGGAAIFVNGALNTRIINSTFLDNYAHYNGGGIFWSYGYNGSIVNSTFINNTATQKGGAVYHIGNNITFTDNIFKNNDAINGSAIYLNTGNNNVLSKNIVVSNDIYTNGIASSIISDSIILDKMICNASNISFAGNWFGNTKNNFNESLNEYADNWLYLNASANKASPGENTSVEFYFNQFNNSQTSDISVIALNLTSNNVILDKNSVLTGQTLDAHITDFEAYINASYENVIFKYEIPIADINVLATNLTKYFSDPQRFIVSIFDSKGNPISNKSLNMIIHGVRYERISDENGSSSIGINLNPGTYDLTLDIENTTLNYTVCVLPTVDADNLVKVFRNESQYYATFKDSKGDLLKNKDVLFNINGISYVRTTDEEGIAKLNINLNQGIYIITAANPQTGEMHSNNITVLSRFSENSDLVKYYRNDSQYIVRIIGDDGNPVGAGENVSFNINGVFYTRTTNATGYVKLNINLEPGNYIVTAEYKGCMVSNNISVKPVLTAEDLTKKYGAPDQFIATLVDGRGNPLAGEKITFNINGIFYSEITDSNGKSMLKINLNPGEYIITSQYDKAVISNKITITS